MTVWLMMAGVNLLESLNVVSHALNMRCCSMHVTSEAGCGMPTSPKLWVPACYQLQPTMKVYQGTVVCNAAVKA